MFPSSTETVPTLLTLRQKDLYLKNSNIYIYVALLTLAELNKNSFYVNKVNLRQRNDKGNQTKIFHTEILIRDLPKTNLRSSVMMWAI